MSGLLPYSYTVLRYMHDTTTGEFVNVGVALYSPGSNYVGAKCRTTYGRISKTFPGINPDNFKSLMRFIQSRFEKIGDQMTGLFPLESKNSILEIARQVLPSDDSSLQWSPMGTGRTADPAVTLEKLFDRMVMRYEEHTSHNHRTEEDVWRHFKNTLESKQLLDYFQPKKIVVKDDEIEFKHTWKNGMYHCLEAVSFDLSSPDGIKDKAHRWLGRVTSIADAQDKFRLYFLVGQPNDKSLTSAYENALSILNKVPVENQIFLENQAEDLSELLEQQVSSHEGQVH